jgi:hypothetical protein
LPWYSGQSALVDRGAGALEDGEVLAPGKLAEPVVLLVLLVLLTVAREGVPLPEVEPPPESQAEAPSNPNRMRAVSALFIHRL